MDSAEGYRNGYGKPRRRTCARTCSSADAGSWTTGGPTSPTKAENLTVIVSVCYSRDHSWQRLTTSAPYFRRRRVMKRGSTELM